MTGGARREGILEKEKRGGGGSFSFSNFYIFLYA
jgi:hypothetical protein